MAKVLHYALIGATGIGGYHLGALREIEKDGLIVLTAVADPALGRLPELQNHFDQTGVSGYLDYRELLRQEPELDAIVISAPIPFHLEMTLACLERDLFVYLEKPPVPLIQQWETMIETDKNSRIGVGFQMINSRGIQESKQAVTRGKLGQVREIRISACWPRLDQYYQRNHTTGKMSLHGEPIFDGPATNALAHLIHNAMFLASPDSGTYDAPAEITAELYRARPIESYDLACLRGTFRSGVMFSAALTHATEALLPYRLEVRGSEGWVRVSNDGTVFESSFGGPVDCAETFEQQVEKTHRQFLAFALGEQPRPSTSLPDALGYILATNGMLLSSGGIHSIDASHVRRYARGEGRGYDVVGLHDAVQASGESGALFSEMGLPWSVRTAPVSVEGLKYLKFGSLFNSLT